MPDVIKIDSAGCDDGGLLELFMCREHRAVLVEVGRAIATQIVAKLPRIRVPGAITSALGPDGVWRNCNEA